MRHRSLKSALAAIGMLCAIAAQDPKASADPGRHGNPHVPRIESTSVVKAVDPFNPNPTERLYGTLDMMDLVKTKGEKIVVIAHEVFPPSIPGGAGQLDTVFPDAYDGLNRGLGLGAVSAWNLKTGEFWFLIPPKNTVDLESYDESKHTSGTDGVRATDWGSALIAEEWTQRAVLGVQPARGGHILEVDPLNPGALSRVKVMGTFSHEGITIQKLNGDYVFYQGDEQRGGGSWSNVPAVSGFACAGGTSRRGGAFYRFIPNKKPEAFGDLQANGGTIQAFDFLTQQWITVPQAVVAADNPEVLRCWADSTLSPISLWERPEDVEYDQAGKVLYFAVTEKSCLVANGQCLVDANGNTIDQNGNPVSFDGVRNRAGHVVRLDPDTGNWSIFVDADTLNAQLSIQDPVFGNPDNLVLDHEGRLYIAQDGGDPNDSIWIATPDKDGNGVADRFERFLNMADAGLGVPASCGEPTGFLFLHEKALLFNFQGGPRPNDFGVVQDPDCPTPISRIMQIELGGTEQ